LSAKCQLMSKQKRLINFFAFQIFHRVGFG
jgi:hypothetical protein